MENPRIARHQTLFRFSDEGRRREKSGNAVNMGLFFSVVNVATCSSRPCCRRVFRRSCPRIPQLHTATTTTTGVEGKELEVPELASPPGLGGAGLDRKYSYPFGIFASIRISERRDAHKKTVQYRCNAAPLGTTRRGAELCESLSFTVASILGALVPAASGAVFKSTAQLLLVIVLR